MKFRVGQLVRIVCAPHRPHLFGEVTEIAGGPVPYPYQPGGDYAHGAPIYELALKTAWRENYLALPQYLEPVHEPGDFTSLAELLRSVKGEPAKERA